MMYPKKIRKRDKKLLAKLRGEPCQICGKTDTVGHHLKTVGSGGDDDILNLMVLCTLHHRMIHDIGHDSFFEKFGLD